MDRAPAVHTRQEVGGRVLKRREPIVCEERYFTPAENREFVDDILNGVITGRCRMPDDVEVHFTTHLDVPVTAVKLRIDQLCVEVLLIDYEPVCKISAPQLFTRSDIIWRSDDPFDFGIGLFAPGTAARDAKLRAGRAARRAAQERRDGQALALLDHAETITNWMPIPAHVQVDCFAYTIRHEVTH